MLTTDAAGRCGTFRAGGLPVDLLPQGGLGELQRLLLRLIGAAHARLADDLPVEQHVAQLPDGDSVRAGALRPEFGWNGEGRFDGHALPRVAGSIDVRQVVAGDFRSGALRLQRAVGHAKAAE